jgi:serine/threonine protein phosphatase PrpC
MTDALPPQLAAVVKCSLAISLGQYSGAGAKPENQDFHGALQPDGADLAAKGIALCIADGISTSRQGAAAAETAVKTFLTDYFCTSPAWSVQTSGERVITATNSWMFAQNRRTFGPPMSEGEREQGLICTFSAMVLKGRTAHVFHIGDARIVRLSGTSVEELTEPHRVYVGGGESYLGRALGVNRHVEIDYKQVRLEKDDLFVLTTDGVHEHITDQRMAEIIAASPDLEAAAWQIAQQALEAGSSDNLTVQVLRVDRLPDGGLEELIGQDTSLPAAPELREGMEFEGFEIRHKLHSGSRSHVYAARDLGSGRSVVLKVLSTELAQDPAAMTSLLLEEWIMRRLDHPNLLAAGPVPVERRHAYSVSEFVAGQSLHAWMLDHALVELATVRDLVKQVASGLQALHRREMVHRDLRPHNILVDEDGRARIIDFGSVQVAGLDELSGPLLESAYAGTMQYSAPELYLGYPATPQSDIFSLGVIAYQLLTGQLPYGPRVAAANTPAAQRRLSYVPVAVHNPDVPDWMDAAIRKAVSIDPNRRYSELFEFVVDLSKPNQELVSGAPPLIQRGTVRHWQIISALLAAALALSFFTRPDVVESFTLTQQETQP